MAREETAELGWGLLHGVKAQVARMASGKLTGEEVRGRNRRSIMQLVRIAQALRLQRRLALVPAPAPTPTPTVPLAASSEG